MAPEAKLLLVGISLGLTLAVHAAPFRTKVQPALLSKQTPGPGGFQRPLVARMQQGPFARKFSQQLHEENTPKLKVTLRHKKNKKMYNNTNASERLAHYAMAHLLSWHEHSPMENMSAHKHMVCKKGRAAKIASAVQKKAPIVIAKPGTGADQTLADNGLDTHAVIDGQGVLEKAYKDGYSLVGCYKDSMLDFADKFSDNADQYKNQANVSVVVYKDAVLKDQQKPMKPEVCFDLCRTVAGMGYFGIAGGRECYCTPYYKSAESGSETCDQPCPGNPSEMCGGKTKSSIFEMHFCNDAAQDLIDAATAAGQEMMYMYSSAWSVHWRASGLQRSAAELQKLAGLGGDPVASDWGQQVKVFAGDLEHVLWDGTCFEAYKELHTVYMEAKTIKDLDFFLAANLEKADTATFDMIHYGKIVGACSDKALAEYFKLEPWAKEQAQSWKGDDGDWDWKKAKAWQNKHIEDARSSFSIYYPLGYAFNQGDPNARSMSVCGGDLIGSPMSHSLIECAKACDMTVYPTKCVGYQHFNFGGNRRSGGWMGPICLLLSSFKSLTLYPECTFLKKRQPRKWGERWQRPIKPGADAECDKVALYVYQFGTTCERAFGSRSAIIQKCDEVCSKAKGTLVSATCDVSFAWLSGYKPKVEIKENKGCFGGDENKFVDGHDEWPRWEPPEKGFGPGSMPSPWWPDRFWTDYEYSLYDY